MALPLNRYRTIFTQSLTQAGAPVYTAPTGYNSVVLAITACNTSIAPHNVSLTYSRGTQENSLVNLFAVPGYDTADLTTGKLVIEQNDSISASATDPSIHLTISVLEARI
jgi:hypothetical protein